MNATYIFIKPCYFDVAENYVLWTSFSKKSQPQLFANSPCVHLYVSV